jgi:hypothetical protein
MNRQKYAFTWLVFLLLHLTNSAKAQTDAFNLKLIGFEVQGYPTGIMPGLCLDFSKWKHAAISAKVGINIAHRKDFSGLNDDERGWGPGIGLGYRYYAGENCSGFYAGARADLWSLTIAWRDSTNFPIQGTTDLVVLMPTLELGYMFQPKKSPYRIGIGTAQGREFNLVSKGKDVGQGYITLITLKGVKYF